MSFINGQVVYHWLVPQPSLDQPSAHEFTKYMGQQSSAPLLESARARSWLYGELADQLLLYGPCVTCQDHWQPTKDRWGRQDVYCLLPGQGFIDQLWATLGDPWYMEVSSMVLTLIQLWFEGKGSDSGWEKPLYWTHAETCDFLC